MVMDKQNLKVIRGARILQQLEEAGLLENTYSEFERNTMNFQPASKKRQHATASVQVQNMEFSAIPHSQSLLVEGTIRNYGSETKLNAVYMSRYLFRDVEFVNADTEEEVANPNTLTIEGKNGKEFTIVPIQLNKQNVLVGCNCLDFFWRTSRQHHNQNSLFGYDVGTYRKRTNRPPVNPYNKTILCKHLLKLAEEMKRNGVVR